VNPLRLIGIEGGDDVGMIELGGRLHFPQKASEGVGLFDERGGQNFERHDAVHPPLVRLENRPHPPFAELVENDVAPQDEPLRLPLVDSRGLIGGELLLADQFAGELLAVAGPAGFGKAVDDRADLGLGHQPACDQLIYELIETERHGSGAFRMKLALSSGGIRRIKNLILPERRPAFTWEPTNSPFFPGFVHLWTVVTRRSFWTLTAQACHGRFASWPCASNVVRCTSNVNRASSNADPNLQRHPETTNIKLVARWREPRAARR
jgi:hypothetical protein